MEKYIVTHISPEDGTGLCEFLDLDAAIKNIKEDLHAVMEELKSEGYSPTLLHEDTDGTEIYVPDTGIYHSWTISKIESADYKKMYVISAAQGERDNRISPPIWTVPEEAMAQLICEEFEAKGSNKYKEHVKAVLKVTALDDVSLHCSEVPFLARLQEPQPAFLKQIRKAELLLIDNGIDPGEAVVVLQALGYALLDRDLYDDTSSDFSLKTAYPEDKIEKAEQVLADNGIDPDETDTVLQALGYTLFDTELYPKG